jgi:hypothetical protein
MVGGSWVRKPQATQPTLRDIARSAAPEMLKGWHLQTRLNLVSGLHDKGV